MERGRWGRRETGSQSRGKNPLYRPWLAASDAVILARSRVIPKVRIPSGLCHSSISTTRNQTWRAARMPPGLRRRPRTMFGNGW